MCKFGRNKASVLDTRPTSLQKPKGHIYGEWVVYTPSSFVFLQMSELILGRFGQYRGQIPVRCDLGQNRFSGLDVRVGQGHTELDIFLYQINWVQRKFRKQIDVLHD